MSKKRVELYEEVLPDGRCKYRMPYADPLTGKSKTVSMILDKQSASNYKLAKRKLEEKIDEIMEKTNPNNITFKRLCELYFAEKSRTLKESTLQRNKGTYGRMSAWIGPNTLVDNLTAPFLKNIIQEHSAENKTYNEYLKRLKTLLNWAYMNDIITDRNMIDKLQSLPDNKKQRIEDKYLESDELQKLLDAMEVPTWKYVTHFLALSGLRVGELIALKDKDVGVEYIIVNKTYEINVEKVGTPKTDTSNREVYVRKELAFLIKEIRKYMREYKFKNRIKSDLFICGKDGGYLHYDAYRKYLAENSASALNHKITPHALRHTAASLLIADGVPLETVSRMLGHDGSKVTKEIYLHVTQKLKEKDKEYLKNAKVL